MEAFRGRRGGAVLKLFHVTYGINGPKDQILKEMKNHCSIWNVESIYLFFSPTDIYSRKTVRL